MNDIIYIELNLVFYPKLCFANSKPNLCQLADLPYVHYQSSIIISSSRMSELKISWILEKPLTQQQWPQLETIMKMLNDYITHCIKNREYIEAQKAKDKITEAQQEIRKRNFNDIELRQQRASDDMRRKHQEEMARINKEYEVGKRKIEVQYDELINRKLEKHQSEKEKHLQQIELALPYNSSPNKQLFQLRHEEEDCVRMGNFMEAQRIKVEIARKQQQLSSKNQKLRESNIKVMMGQLEHKHRAEVELLENKRDEKIMECKKKHAKKEKQLTDKQEREIKELHWIYGEEKKRYK